MKHTDGHTDTQWSDGQSPQNESEKVYFFCMRFDVCTDPDPKEAESLETDLSADSFLFRE